MRQVRASICKFDNRKSPYRVRWKPRISDKYVTQWFSSRAQAEAFKKQTEVYENGFSDLSENANLQEIRESQLLLKQTNNECAKGKSIQFAVNWFIKNYQGDENIHPIKHYYREYEKIRASAKGKQKLSKYQLSLLSHSRANRMCMVLNLFDLMSKSCLDGRGPWHDTACGLCGTS